MGLKRKLSDHTNILGKDLPCPLLSSVDLTVGGHAVIGHFPGAILPVKYPRGR